MTAWSDTKNVVYPDRDAAIRDGIRPVLIANDLDCRVYDLREVAARVTQYSPELGGHFLACSFERLLMVVVEEDRTDVMFDLAADVAEDIDAAGVAAADVLRSAQYGGADFLPERMVRPLRALASHYLDDWMRS